MKIKIKLPLLLMLLVAIMVYSGCASQHYPTYYSAHKEAAKAGEKTNQEYARALGKVFEYGTVEQKAAALNSLTWMAATHKVVLPEAPKAGPAEKGFGRLLEQGPWVFANWITGYFAGDKININSTNDGGYSVIGAKGNISSEFRPVDIGLEADNGSIIGGGSITDTYAPVSGATP